MQNASRARLTWVGFCLIFISIFHSSWALAGEIRLSLTSPQYSVAAKQTGDFFEIPRFGHIEEPGAPALPMNLYWVALPPNAVDGSISLSVLNKTSVPISEKLELTPVRPATTEPSGDPPQKVINHLFETRDLRIYGKSALFPAQSLRMGHVSKMRKTKLIPVTFYPIQYNPITKEAVWARHIRFKLSFDEGQPVSPTAATTDDMTAAKTDDMTAAKNLPGPILNAQDLDTWYGEDKTRVGLLSLLGDGYAIITTDAVKASVYDPVGGMLRQFAAHKDGLGYTVYLVTETQAHHHPGGTPEAGYGSATGQQRAVNIRNWLMANHDAAQKNIKYVLLIGDPDPDDPEDAGDPYGDIPMMMCFPEFVPLGAGTGTPKAPTDYFYAELSGDWNLDGDSRYCEYSGDHGTGGVEFTPEVYVGRIPFSDSTRVEMVLQKVLDYENVSYSSSDNSTLVWRKKALLPMSILNFGSTAWWGCPGDGSNVSDDAYLGVSSEKYLLHPNGFDSFLMTEQDGDPTYPVTVSPIIGDARLAEGIDAHWDITKYYGIVFWSVHGTETYVSRKYWPDSNSCPKYSTVFSTADCNNLSDDYPAFVISTSCNIGYPENSGNLATKLIEKGAISAVAGSRTLWYVEGDFSSESADYLPKPIHLADLRTTAYWFTEQLTQDVSAGDALFYAKQAKSTNSSMAWVNNFGMNLYGDPSLKILPPSFSDTDSDADGLSDDEELYIYQSNPNQQDSDGDGLLDNEELVYMEGAWMYDLDGDGDNALNDKDSDGDGLDDDVEILVLLTHPRITDTDNDGLSDFEEVNRDGDPGNYTPGTYTDPNDADTDDDGVNDGDEVNAGMNPLDPWDNKATADAGPDQSVDAQTGGVTVVELDGTGSSDPNDDPLFFYWKVESTISEYYSGGYIQPYTSPTPTLYAPVGGDYQISLKVREDRQNYVWSDLDYVTIYVQHKITGLSPQPCRWGDTLTISGLGFDKDPAQNTVTIGGLQVLVTSASYSELQVTVPAGTAEGDVIVTVNTKASNAVPCSIDLPAGSFSLASNGSVPALNDCSQNVAIGDVDGDDDVDIVVANMGGLSAGIHEYEDSACMSMDPQNRLYINNGQGVFTDETSGPDGLAGTSDDRLPMDTDQSRDIKLVDIDDDDDLDIVIANYGAYKEWWQDVGMDMRLVCSGTGEQNRIYLNNGQGLFTDETSSRLPSLSDPTVAIAVGDIDGDDDPDLIFANDQACEAAQWLEPTNPDCCWECGDCNGFDCEWDPFHPCCTGECDSCGPCCDDCMNCPSNPGCQPYNTPQASQDVFYLNNGGGIFSDVTATIISSIENATATRSLALADMDGDNDPDMVRSGYMGSYTGTRLFDNNLGSFSLVAPQVDNGNGREIVLANFDSDGGATLDVFIPRTNEYPIYRVQEGGVFVNHSDWLPGNTTYSNDYRDSVAAASADVDLDGDPDVVIGRKNSEPNRLFTNNDGSPGHFEYTAGMLPELSESTFGVTFGDVNGDRAPDLFFANVGQNTLLINNTETTEPCEGDFEPDGDVDGSDLAVFAADFGRTNCDVGDPCEGDFDTDNDVDGSDLAVFAADFGRTDCPE